LLAKVDHHSLRPVSGSPKFVFPYQGDAIDIETCVHQMHLVQFGYHGLDQGDYTNGFVYGETHIANPEFDGTEERVHSKIPPDFFGIIDAVGLDQSFQKIII
jgi:hypothetical protein